MPFLLDVDAPAAVSFLIFYDPGFFEFYHNPSLFLFFTTMPGLLLF